MQQWRLKTLKSKSVYCHIHTPQKLLYCSAIHGWQMDERIMFCAVLRGPLSPRHCRWERWGGQLHPVVCRAVSCVLTCKLGAIGHGRVSRPKMLCAELHESKSGHNNSTVSQLIWNDSSRLASAFLGLIFFQLEGMLAGFALYALANSLLNFAMIYFQ